MNYSVDSKRKNYINKLMEIENKLLNLDEKINLLEDKLASYALRVDGYLANFSVLNVQGDVKYKNNSDYYDLIFDIKKDYYGNLNNFKFTLLHAKDFIRVIRNQVCCAYDKERTKHDLYFDFSDDKTSLVEDYTKIINNRYAPISIMEPYEKELLLLVINSNEQLKMASDQLIADIIYIENEVKGLTSNIPYKGHNHLEALLSEVMQLKTEMKGLSEKIKNEGANTQDTELFIARNKDYEQRQGYLDSLIMRSEFNHNNKELSKGDTRVYLDKIISLMSSIDNGDTVIARDQHNLVRPLDKLLYGQRS
ncbi:TPA: hypothetical protein U2M59_001883 [Providencia stuartii]|nr:hypothetical protein [Providencia stuartii]